MKVIISGYVGKKITGIGRNLINILNNIDENNSNEYILYCNEDMYDTFKENLKDKIEIKSYNVSKDSSFKNLLWTTFIFPFKTIKEKATVVLIPNFTFMLLKFKPTVLIMHDLIEYNVPNKFSKIKMFYRTKLANPISSKLANKIITVSYNSKKDIMKFLGVRDEKIEVIYNGIDRSLFNIKNNSKSDKFPDEFILYAGTLDHPGKNAFSVLKAFEILKKEGYNHKLVLAGMPGKGFEILEQEVEKSKYKNDIIITGYVTDDELIELYNSCDVFCFVSLYEGFGIPPLEALACGSEVIVSNNSSLPEVVGNLAYKVEPTDEIEIKNKIVSILNGDKLNTSKQALEEHLDKFNWKNISFKFEQELLKQSK